MSDIDLPPSIATLPAARKAVHDYLGHMKTHPWGEGMMWNQTVTVMELLCEYVDEDPPNLKACSSRLAIMEKGGGGSRIYLESCPDAKKFGEYCEAFSWLHQWQKGSVRDHQPLPASQRKTDWLRHERRRTQAIAVLDRPAPTQPVARFSNTPEGWAQIEKSMKLPPGSLRSRAPKSSSASRQFIVAKTQPDGTTKYEIRKKFPGKTIAVSGPWWRQLWFKLTGR